MEPLVNSVVCPFCASDMDSFLATTPSNNTPATFNNSLSICDNCFNAGMFFLPEGSQKISLRRLREEEWTNLLINNPDAIQTLNNTASALRVARALVEKAESLADDASIDDYLSS